MSTLTDALVPLALVATPVLMEFASSDQESTFESATSHTLEVARTDEEASAEFVTNDTAFMEPTDDSHVRVASFNMLHVGQYKDKDFERLAQIVNQFDLCSVLELENEQALRDLTGALGSDWEHLISEREAGKRGHDGTFEFYGFVYRTGKVIPLDEPRGFFPDPEETYSREPYFASFRAGQFDFTIIALHAESPGNGALLTRELELLGDVFDYVQDLDPNENDILLTGDFNRSPSTPTGKVTLAWQALLSRPSMDCVIPDTELTTLSSKPRGFANHYDEICLQTDHTAEYTGRRGSFDFVTVMFNGENAPAKRFVSDHLPVWAEFRTDLPDDDGVTPGVAASPDDDGECCKICRTSQACGNGCIARGLTCKAPSGCACQE